MARQESDREGLDNGRKGEDIPGERCAGQWGGGWERAWSPRPRPKHQSRVRGVALCWDLGSRFSFRLPATAVVQTSLFSCPVSLLLSTSKRLFEASIPRELLNLSVTPHNPESSAGRHTGGSGRPHSSSALSRQPGGTLQSQLSVPVPLRSRMLCPESPPPPVCLPGGLIALEGSHHMLSARTFLFLPPRTQCPT